MRSIAVKENHIGTAVQKENIRTPTPKSISTEKNRDKTMDAKSP